MSKRIHVKIILSVLLVASIIAAFQVSAAGRAPRGDMDYALGQALSRGGLVHCDPLTAPGEPCMRDPGPTGRFFPDGLNFASFNNYTDNAWPSDLPDEREFFQVQKLDSNGSVVTGRFSQSVVVSPGDKLRLRAYVHNDADPEHNDSYSAAKNVRTRVDTFKYAPDIGTLDFATDLASQFTIRNYLTASNTQPREITDDVSIQATEPVRLRFLPERVAKPGIPGARFAQGGGDLALNPFDLFNAGAPIKSHPLSIPSSDFFGSEDYRGFVFVDVEVIKPVVKCVSIQLNRNTFEVVSGQNAPVGFSLTQVNPANYPGTFTWTVSPGGSGIIAQTQDGRTATLLNARPGVSVSVAPTDPTEQGCRQTIPSTTPPEPLMCQDIAVNRNTFEVVSGQNAPVGFSLTQVNPANYPGTFTWTVSPGGSGIIAQTQDGRTATLLNARPGVSVSVAPSDPTQVSPGCRKVIPSTTPAALVCQEIRMTPQTFNPAGGPVQFRLDGLVASPGYSTNNFVWRANGMEFGRGTSAILQLPNPRITNVSVVDETLGSICRNEINVIPPQQVNCDSLDLSPYPTFELPNPVPAGGYSQSVYARVYPINFVGTLTLLHLDKFTNEEIEQARTTSDYSILATLNLTERSLIRAQATPANNQAECVKQATPVIAAPPTARPDGVIRKTARNITRSGGGNTLRRVGDEAEFAITFTPRGTSQIPELFIRDASVVGGEIIGLDGGRIRIDQSNVRIQKRKSGGGLTDIKRCFPNGIDNPVPCYEGNPFNGNRIVIKNLNYDEVVVITYRGKLIYTPVNAAYCKTPNRVFCGEQFTNNVDFAFSRDERPRQNASASLFVPCPFLITRGLGDVILRQDLAVGADIKQCFGVPNIEPPVFIPPDRPRDIPKTGSSEDNAKILNIPPFELCQKSGDEKTSDDKRPDQYKNPLKSISSAVCEVSMTLADILEPPRIREDVKTNITRLMRNSYVLTKNVLYNLDAVPALLPSSASEEYKIYKSSGPLTIQGPQVIGEGARTFVVEKGDLIINGNLTYADIPFDLKALNKIPSIAFIVLEGDIIIDPSVTQLSGIFVALNGSVRSKNNVVSDETLKVSGSIYGDIEPLFESRQFTGNARSGEGTISIVYDGRLYYNLPPGLQEVLNIKQEQVAR